MKNPYPELNLSLNQRHAIRHGFRLQVNLGHDVWSDDIEERHTLVPPEGHPLAGMGMEYEFRLLDHQGDIYTDNTEYPHVWQEIADYQHDFSAMSDLCDHLFGKKWRVTFKRKSTWYEVKFFDGETNWFRDSQEGFMPCFSRIIDEIIPLKDE